MDLELLSQSGRQAIHDNARASADQTEFADKHRSLVAKYEESSPRLAELEADRNRRREQGKILKSFIKEIETRELVLEEFDEKLWLAVIDHVTILANGRLVFTFMDGTSVE